MRLFLLFGFAVLLWYGAVSAAVPASSKKGTPRQRREAYEKKHHLNPGERKLRPGELCPATIQAAMSVGAARSDVCTCGGREAHILSKAGEMEMGYAPGHERKRKSITVTKIFSSKGEDDDDTDDL